MDGTGYFNHIVRAPFEHVIVQQVYDKIGLDQEQYMIPVQVIILSCFFNQLFVPSKHEQIQIPYFLGQASSTPPWFFCAPKHSETTVRWAAGKTRHQLRKRTLKNPHLHTECSHSPRFIIKM